MKGEKSTEGREPAGGHRGARGEPLLSAWRGFEIDSSEGYYVFQPEWSEGLDGWTFLLRLLDSPLLWDKVNFDFSAKEGKEANVDETVKGYLASEGRPGDDNILNSSRPLIRKLLPRLQHDLERVDLDFCIAPLATLPKTLRRDFKEWFVNQFSDPDEGRERWEEYRAIQESDLELCGYSRQTDEWSDHYAFEASLIVDVSPPSEETLFFSAGDPSLMIYLLQSLAKDYVLEYRGDHGISIDRSPDELWFNERGDDEEEMEEDEEDGKDET